MPWDDWRVNMNKKLDDFGDDAMKKIRQQREAGAGGSKVGLSERVSMAKGGDPRWQKDLERRRAGEEEPALTATGNAVPPSRYTGIANKGAPPPPPVRRTSSGAPPPVLPPRMANEAGTSNPPPPYLGDQHGLPTSEQGGHVQFSQFTEDDKQAFFGLLDEYFDQKARGIR